jgi:hypothetical protein
LNMKKKIIILFLSFGILLASISYAADWDAKELITYFGYTSKQVKIEWDPSDQAVDYQLRLKHVERDAYEQSIVITTPEATFNLPRTGHYIVEVRARNVHGDSSWAVSNNIATFNTDQYKPFWVYGYPEPAGPISIF